MKNKTAKFKIGQEVICITGKGYDPKVEILGVSVKPWGTFYKVRVIELNKIVPIVCEKRLRA